MGAGREEWSWHGNIDSFLCSDSQVGGFSMQKITYWGMNDRCVVIQSSRHNAQDFFGSAQETTRLIIVTDEVGFREGQTEDTRFLGYMCVEKEWG